MLQKYFPILGEINSPLAMMAALNFTASTAQIAISGISNEVLESLLKEEVENTSVHKAEVEVAASELEVARKAAAKTVRYGRYRAAQAARSARRTSKMANRIKAVRRPVDKTSLKGLSGLSIEICRSRAVESQAAVRTATNNFYAALEAVEKGDTRAIRSSVAALKEAVRTLEVRHLELRFAREVLSIALARHSA